MNRILRSNRRLMHLHCSVDEAIVNCQMKRCSRQGDNWYYGSPTLREKALIVLTCVLGVIRG